MNIPDQLLSLLNDLKSKIEAHKLKSGEIILEIDSIEVGDPYDFKRIINVFIQRKNLKVSNPNFSIFEIQKEKAIDRMKYGFSSKPNYTLIENQFSCSDQNTITYGFISLFDKPRFYSINVRLYKDDLDLGDFWQSGGAFAIDQSHIGLLWVNDLYDKF